MTSEDATQVVAGALIAVVDMVNEETKRGYAEVAKHYGADYARAWRAGRQQAVEEIRAL